MVIYRKNEPFFISYIEEPRIWYPINLSIARYGADYIKEKLGVTDPAKIQFLQDEFNEFRDSNTEPIEDHFEHHTFRYDKTDIPFYLIDQVNDSVTIFMEKGLFKLSPNRPLGYVWADIEKADTVEMIQAKLYDNQKRLSQSLHKKLHKICGW